MKALEILKEISSLSAMQLGQLRVINGLQTFANKNLNEAIAELEALQASKSCDGCKWEFEDFRLSNGFDVCNYCTREHIDRYEPKGSK
jgi:hypothetical protein